MNINILKKCQSMKFNSVAYVEEEEMADVHILHESERCYLLVKDTGRHLHIFWGANSKRVLLEELAKIKNKLRGKSLYIEFIPRDFIEPLEELGFEIYSEFADFWNNQLVYDANSLKKPDTTLRPVRSDETQLLVDITQKCKGQSRGFDGETEESLNEWLATENSTILVAEISNKPVGLAMVSLYGFDSEKGTALWVRLLAVSPEYQRKGIGRQLLSYALNWGSKNKAVRAFLHADVHNDNAIKLYQDKGFEMNKTTTQMNMMLLR